VFITQSRCCATEQPYGVEGNDTKIM
jgi:hypothetical protein